MTYIIRRPVRALLGRVTRNIQNTLGARYVAHFHHLDYGTARMTDDGGGLISSWRDRLTNFEVAALSSDARPIYREGRGLRFAPAGTAHLGVVASKCMESANMGPIPTAGGTTSSSMFVIARMHRRNSLVNNEFAVVGSGANRRGVLWTTLGRPGSDSHTPANMPANSGAFRQPLVCIQVKWGTATETRYNGVRYSFVPGSSPTTAGKFRIGLSLANVWPAWADIQQIVYIHGVTSLDEDEYVEATLLGDDAYKVLGEGHKYGGVRKTVSFAQNIAALNAAIDAAPASTPDAEAVMASPPSMTFSANVTVNTTTYPNYLIGAPGLEPQHGWQSAVSTYMDTVHAIIGHTDVGTPANLYSQNNASVLGVLHTGRYLTIRTYHASPLVKPRIMVKQAGDVCPKYIDKSGTTFTPTGGWVSRVVELDFGSVAEREVYIELSGFYVHGFYTTADAMLESIPNRPAKDMRVAWQSDSFALGTGAAFAADNFARLTADRLNLPCNLFGAVVGSGWAKGAALGDVYSAQYRLPDLVDQPLDERVSLGLTTITPRTDARAIIWALGMNDVDIANTEDQWVALIGDIVARARFLLPTVPIILLSPWNIYQPSAVSAGWRAIDNALRRVARATENCVYICLEGTAYTMVGGGNVHPTSAGYQELANILAPQIKEAFRLLQNGRKNVLRSFTSGMPPETTFSRSTPGSYTNSSGLIQQATAGTPRIHYDRVTLVSQGVLLEEATSNLIAYSEEIDNAWWTKYNCTITANATTAPDGTMTADAVVETTAVYVNHGPGKQLTFDAATTYIMSIFGKADTRGWIYLFLDPNRFGGSGYTYFNVSTGQVGVTLAGATAFTVLDANGFYRCVVIATTTSGGLGNFGYGLAAGDNVPTYTGDGSRLFMWGAEIKPGDTLTSYVKTSGAAAPRAADVVTITDPAILVNRVLTIRARAPRTSPTASGVSTLFHINNGTHDERRAIVRYKNNGHVYMLASVGGVDQAAFFMGVVAGGEEFTITCRLAHNYFAAALNNGTLVTSNFGIGPTGLGYALLGHAPGGGQEWWNSTIAAFSSEPDLLDSELAGRVV